MSEEITAPVSGNVWKILVKVGDSVQCDDELMILEALKMENLIYSPGRRENRRDQGRCGR